MAAPGPRGRSRVRGDAALIFVTVGGQGPFDRLVLAVDAWAAATGRDDVFAQIGRGATPPRHVASAAMLSPEEFTRRFREASLVIAHAGLGTILTAIEHGRPILVMPRRASLGEQRNDHQIDTAQRLSKLMGLQVAADETELRRRLDHLEDLTPPRPAPDQGADRLRARLRRFVEEG